MSWTADLLTGLAQLLDDEDVATWKATGSYDSGDVRPVVIDSAPAQPDEVIVLAAYTVDEDAALNDVVQGVQIRTRGTKLGGSPDTTADLVFDVLHGASDLVLGETDHEVHVVLIRRVNSTPLGVDANGRHERVDNYYVTAARPSPHRPD